MSYIRHDQVTEEQNRAFIERIKDFQSQRHYQNKTEEKSDLSLMLSLIEEISEKDSDDDFNFRTRRGTNISVSANAVGADLFKDGPDDSPQNIQSAIEVTLAAKAAFEGDSAYLNIPQDPEQLAIMLYAAELVGFTVKNRPENVQIAEEIKQKMDAEWQKMKANPDSKPEAPTATIAANPAPVEQTLGLDM